MKFYEELFEYLKLKKPKKQEVAKKKIQLCKKHGLKEIPTDIEVLLNARTSELNAIKDLLITKPGRTGSGVAVVAIMSYPFRCPHGECAMCPSHTSDNIPQSYTGKEPATLRGIRNDFDPYLQVMNRLEQYIVTGHSPEKVELIIMGGTFMSFDEEYRRDFIYYSYKAMNDFSKMFYEGEDLNITKFKDFFELPGKVGCEKRTKNIQMKLGKMKNKNSDTTLQKEQKKNENLNIRCIGLTIETRPDYGRQEHGEKMLDYGCTRVELGVQSVYDEALENIQRGHTVDDSIESTKELKDLGFKINYHIMPGLPGVSFEKDLEGFKQLFNDESFRPDMLKIYPCMVLKNTELYKKWKKGEYRPLTTERASELIKEFKRHIPPYARVMRVQRDIPTYATEAGVDRTNLRQMIKNQGTDCKCIRCREPKPGNSPKNISSVKDIKIYSQKYSASRGIEYFISIESNDSLLGFLRLRFPASSLRKEITKNSAIVRELHVYGDLIRIGKEGKIQHKGYGKRLLEKAEKLCIENGRKKVLIISGVGVRNYYRKQGYKKEGPYMVKYLQAK